MSKQQDLLDGALRVFARDGYSRASIQSLAAEAGVSTRTIYNMYGNKDALFRAVIIDSATRVADRQIAQLDEIFAVAKDVRTALTRFAHAWTESDPVTEPHFAMMRQIDADIEHIDSDVLKAWRDAGPKRVRGAIARHLAALAASGHLHLGDSDLAAAQLVLLTAGALGPLAATRDADEVINSGIDVFLAAYGSLPR